MIQTMREQNMAYNHKTIGGTGISAILGVNPYKSAYGLWLELTNSVSPTPDNEAMARGRQYEPFVANMYAAAHPEFTVRDNLHGDGETCFVRDPEYDFITGQPDRILWKDDRPAAGLEVKTASANTMTSWGEYGTDQVPEHYLLQTQQYMALTGLHEWKLNCLFFAEENRPITYREYELRFDPDLWQYMRNAAITFWHDHVETGVAPPLNVADATVTRYIKERFPVNVNPLAEATYEESCIISACFAAKKAADEAEQLFEAAKTRLMLAIGDREGLFSDAGKITWKKSKDSSRTDWKAVVEAVGAPPEIITKYTKTTEGARRFLMSAAKGE